MKEDPEYKSLGDFIDRIYIKPLKQYPVFYILFWTAMIMFFVNIAFVGGWIASIGEGESPISPFGIITLVCVGVWAISLLAARRISPYIKKDS